MPMEFWMKWIIINENCITAKCILNHRGSVKLERNSIEELCVADADAVSHFDSVPSLLYLAYVEKGMDIEHGSSFVREKLERSYNELSDESKEIYKEKYEQVMAILGWLKLLLEKREKCKWEY